MKTNLCFVACLVPHCLAAASASILAGSDPVRSQVTSDCRQEGKEDLLFAPVHPGLSLDPTRGGISYPQVNVTIGGDLCRLRTGQKSSRKIQRSPHYLSVELAAAPEDPARIRRAGPSLWLLLLLPLVFMSRRFLRQEGE
jgi:hypothetical protein